ncbi:cell death-inducing p53-target protein 1 [Aethina tumida]|uniref:cell death-inducing p53-target protein 1 n=1 Tax=Aethina tumida TaxID=116153 RepID=UPI00096B2324|nr:cell death-inducing p53-target protein 1 [Aethina tumida]XP_049818832.1 cell death-inducing p53-target protein 1 [Aethina tumida]
MEKSQPPPYTPHPEPPPQSTPYPQHHPHHGSPPPPGFVPTPTVHTIIVSTPLGPTPCHVTCPNCRCEIVTTVDSHPNTKTHLFAFLCCLFGGWICCCIPYCVDSCMTQTHTCPNCGAFIGEYSN